MWVVAYLDYSMGWVDTHTASGQPVRRLDTVSHVRIEEFSFEDFPTYDDIYEFATSVFGYCPHISRKDP